MPLSFSTSTNIRGLKQWVIMKHDQWKGPLIWGAGEGHVWTHRRERAREQRSEGSHVCMHVCICVAVDLEMQPPSWTLSRTSTHFLCWFWWCSAGPAPLSSFVHVLFRFQTSYGFIKLPKERKCGFLFRFSSANDQTLQCQFYKVEWLTMGMFLELWTHRGYTTPRVHCRQSLLVQGTDN